MWQDTWFTRRDETWDWDHKNKMKWDFYKVFSRNDCIHDWKNSLQVHYVTSCNQWCLQVYVLCVPWKRRMSDLRNIFPANISAVIIYLCPVFLPNEPAMPIIHDLIILLSPLSLFGEIKWDLQIKNIFTNIFLRHKHKFHLSIVPCTFVDHFILW